jgi:hypothetical protein
VKFPSEVRRGEDPAGQLREEGQGARRGTFDDLIRFACVRTWGVLAISACLLAACAALPRSATTATPTSTASATPSSEPGGALAVFLASIGTSRYRVSLVRVNGSVATNVEAGRPSSATGMPLPLVSASASRVYFLDGDSSLKSLSPDGRIALVRDMPGNDHVRATFAVSPDDRQIAISTIDYGTKPPLLRLSVEDLKGGNRIEILSSSSRYVWPVAWTQGKLVVAVGDASPGPVARGDFHPWCAASFGACVAENPYAATHGYQLLDPIDGRLLATLAPGECHAIGLLNRAGTLCSESRDPGGLITPTYECRPELTTCLRQVDWTGTITEWTTIATVWFGALNPSATHMAGCCNVNSLILYFPRSTGGGTRRLGDAAQPLWWMDDNHLVSQPFGGQPHIFTLDIGPDLPVQAPGFPVASVPVGVQ